jgi:hypothetical protein
MVVCGVSRASGESERVAERNLKLLLSNRSHHVGLGELSPYSSFRRLVEVWLEDLDLEDRLAESTRALYERTMKQLVMPAFELAVRYEAMARNPVRETARLHKPASTAKSLTVAQVEATRRTARGVATRRGLEWPETPWAVRCDHRGNARHVGPDRSGAGDRQVRCGHDHDPAIGAVVWHGRLTEGQPDLSARPREVLKVQTHCLGAVIHGPGQSAEAGGHRG